jgi:capsular exopolysaccharide synthesis family protein
MSRIEEALRRAREAAPGQAPVVTPAADAPQVGPASVPPPDVFQDPWTLTEPTESEAASAQQGSEGLNDPREQDSGARTAPLRQGRPGAEQIVATATMGHRYLPANGREAAEPRQMPPTGRKSEGARAAHGEGTTRESPSSPPSFEEDARAAVGRPPSDQVADSPAGIALFHGFSPSVAEKIVAAPDIHQAFVEQYRMLAGVLHHAQLEKNTKVIMVTSALPGEGKTLTSMNLALTFSESYRRSVLLIDADLRRPTLHETFQVPNVSGLGDGLRADEEQKLSLVQVSPRLTLLTAGRPDPDPMSGITSDRMRRVLEEAASRFDWVVIDTPPVGLLPDAGLLAEMADGTLLVIRAGMTPYMLVRRAVEAIGPERIVGVVLNRAEAGVGLYGHAEYSYYDSYSGGR